MAYLYDARLAEPRRDPTPAQQAALGKALAARKTCASCGQHKPYCIPRSLGECWQCAQAARQRLTPTPGLQAEPG